MSMHCWLIFFIFVARFRVQKWWYSIFVCNGIFTHFQEKLFVDVQSVTQMLAKYNSIIQSLSEPEVSIKLKSIRESWKWDEKTYAHTHTDRRAGRDSVQWSSIANALNVICHRAVVVFWFACWCNFLRLTFIRDVFFGGDGENSVCQLGIAASKKRKIADVPQWNHHHHRTIDEQYYILYTRSLSHSLSLSHPPLLPFSLYFCVFY